jgi:hypothetical protein
LSGRGIIIRSPFLRAYTCIAQNFVVSKNMITTSRKHFVTLTLLATLAFGPASLRAQWMMTTGWSDHGSHVPVPASFAADGDTILASGNYSFYYNLDPEMSGLLFSTDLGSSWKRIGFYDQNVDIMSAIGVSLLIFEHDSLIYSSDFGQHWAPPSGLPYMDRYSNGPTHMGVHNIARLDNQLFLLADSGYNYLRLYRSADNGQAWERLETTGLPRYPYVFNLANIFALSGHRLLLPMIDSIAHYGFPPDHSVLHFYASNDNGLNWTRQSGLMSENINSLAEIGNHIFVSSDSGLFHSADGGSTWNSILHGSVTSLLAVGNSLFIGSGGVSYSNDLGNHWHNGDWGFDSIDHFRDIKSVGLAVCGETLFATPSSDPPTQNAGGVWRRTFSDFGVSASVSIPGSKAEVLTVYPNPLSQSTTITFSPTASGHADISIVNQLGIEVARIFSGELDAGERSFMWSKPTGLPDGVYECVVRMNAEVERSAVLVLH